MKIDADKCISCARCVEYCPVGCIFEEDGKYIIDYDECVECGVCLRDAHCPTEAIYMSEESKRYPRSIRAAFSDPAVQFPEMNQGGRGTEEMKTNDVTGRFRRGEYGIILEFGRPGTGTRLREVEKVTRFLSALNIRIEEDNALFHFMEDPENGRIRHELLDEKVLSVILELKTTDEQIEVVVTDLMAILETIDTVVSWGLVSRFEEDGSLPVIGKLEKLGISVRPNAKINVGLGRPLVEE